MTLRSCACVSRAWSVAGGDLVWTPRLQCLLRGKRFLGHDIKDRLQQWIGAGAPAAARRAAAFYAEAAADATRTSLARDEIATCPEWQFRFKMAAGESWAARDPWWIGSERRIALRLRRDGRVVSLSDGRPFWGSEGQIAGSWNCETPEGAPTVVTMNGHPSYVLSRHPAHWGLVLQSCWCVLAGFPMQDRGRDPHMEDDALDVSVDDPRQAAEASAYNDGLY